MSKKPLTALESSPLVVDEGGPSNSAGQLDDGEVVPLFTQRTVGALVLVSLHWFQRGSTGMLHVSVLQNYLQ